jgi:molybdopterin molybdotransferase
MPRRDRLARIRHEVAGAVVPLASERVAVAAAARRWLAEAVVAERPVPPFTCSAMDGYALRASEAGGPAKLRVARAIFAGDDPGEPIAPGHAARIYTGAPLPPGADTVVREELAREVDGEVEVREAPRHGENVRQAGEDVRRGGVALEAGVRLGGRQLALVASVGVSEVSVVRPPRVALVSTGDEVVSGRTPNSNGVAVGEALRAMGAEVERRVVGDDLDALAGALERLLEECDAVVTIGGVSVGARDHVPAAIERLGGAVRVHGVPMKPGKPFLFAVARGRPVFGLPGSPSACLVAFEVLARPALLRLCGAARPFPRVLRLPLAERAAGRPGRARFLWARVEEDGRVTPIGRDAAQVRGPALADALVAIGPDAGDLEPGTPVDVWLLEEHCW